MPRPLRKILPLLFVAACRTAAPDTHSATRDPIESPSPDVSAPAALVPTANDASVAASTDAGDECDPAAAPAPLREIACIEGMYSHTMGFSKDGRLFGYCVSTCDPCPSECTFADAKAKKSIRFAFSFLPADPDYQSGKIGEDEAQRRAEKRDAKWTKFLADNAIPETQPQRVFHGPWRFADVAVTTRVTKDAPGEAGTLHVGGRVDGAPPVFPIRLRIGPHPMYGAPSPEVRAAIAKATTAEDKQQIVEEWRSNWTMSEPILAVFDVTPDGQDIGVVAFASGAMWFEAAEMARMRQGEFAARIYEGVASAATDPSRASELREKARDARK
jgi:hypothetical protein